MMLSSGPLSSCNRASQRLHVSVHIETHRWRTPLGSCKSPEMSHGTRAAVLKTATVMNVLTDGSSGERLAMLRQLVFVSL